MKATQDQVGTSLFIVLCIVSFLLSGCGGGSAGSSSGTAPGTSNGGTISISLRWPQTSGKTRLIPVNTETISISVTGEGISSPSQFTTTLIRSQVTGSTANVTFTDVPLGSKTITVKAMDASNNVLALRNLSIVVITGSTSADITLGVSVSDTGFTPRDFAVSPGDTVMWGNDGSLTHTVTADDGTFNSGDIGQGGTYGLNFSALGNFSYHCSRHPSETGRILVQNAPPTIGSITPISATVGSQVTINGSNFGATPGQSTVSFNGVSASVNSWSSTQIICTVPAGATSGNVVVTVGGVTSNGVSFTISNPFDATSYVFDTKWGSTGGGDGQFAYPFAVAVDSAGNVYVADYNNGRIQKFNNSGGFLTKWGSSGNGDGQFNKPRGIAVDSNGNVYVADYFNARIQKFTGTGAFVTKWGVAGNGDGQFSGPVGVGVDSAGNVYVSDFGNNRIQKFDGSGNFITKWGSQGSGDGQFSNPYGIAVDSAGNVYVADDGHRVQKFSTSGAFLAKWGSQGSGDGQFSFPRSVTVDLSGNIYVGEDGNLRIQKFNSSLQFVTKWGSSGASDGQFRQVEGLAVDGNGNVYSADPDGQRIQKFKPGLIVPPAITSISPSSSTVGSQVAINGSNFGATQGQSTVTFNGVSASVVSWSGTQISCTVPNGASSGNVIVTVSGLASNGVNFTVTVPPPGNPAISGINPNSGQVGTQVTITGSNFGAAQGGSTVTFNGVLASPSSWSTSQIVCPVPNGATSGNVVVTVSGVSSNGISFAVTVSPFEATSYVFVTKWGSQGGGDGQFNFPVGTAVDVGGNVYVCDPNNQRVQKFNSSGVFQTKWGSAGAGDGQFSGPYGIAADSGGNIYVVDRNNHRVQKFTSDGVFVAKWGSLGNGDGQFNNPADIAVDGSGNVYVTDLNNNRIQKFNSSGVFATKWGSAGAADGQFNSPYGVAADNSGNVYVVDTYNYRIQKFNGSGVFLTKWGTLGNGDGQFNNAFRIATDPNGNVYVADMDNDRLQKFNSNGGFITKWGSFGGGDGQFNNSVGIALDSSGNVYVTDEANHRVQKFRPGP
ncbi:MAG: IPT/TIG domain-containing protein [Armatimonadetes bacterium]|nr:IPT/TIG domain-containing protein [Armatimonadota bacterium]